MPDDGLQKRLGTRGLTFLLSFGSRQKEAWEVGSTRVKEEEGFPRVRVEDHEGLHTSLGNEKFVESMHFFACKYASIIEENRRLSFAKHTTPRPLRSKIGHLLKSRPDFAWTLKGDGAVEANGLLTCQEARPEEEDAARALDERIRQVLRAHEQDEHRKWKERAKGPEQVRHNVAPNMGAGGSHLQATLTHEERQQSRQHERETQEVNEEQIERETTEDEGHVDDLFQDDTNERGKGRSQEECEGSRRGKRVAKKHRKREHRYEEEKW